MDPETLVAHARRLRVLARRLLVDDGQADDVVQEACLAALRRPPGPEVPLRAWLGRVVRNLALRRRREEARRRRRERAVARPEQTPPPVEVVARAETHRRLVQAVLALDEPYRATLLLRYFDGLSIKEVAARLGVAPGTVGARIHRALEMLRGRLDANFGDRAAWSLALLPLAGLRRSSVVAATWGVVAVSAKKTVSLVLLLAIAGALLIAVTWTRRTTDRPARETAVSGAVGATGTRPELAAAPAIDRDLDLHGLVVDVDGAPVGGASVATWWNPWLRASVGDPRRRHAPVAGPRTTTAADGSFRLRLGRGQRVNLTVTAAGHAPAEILYVQAGEKMRVVLSHGVRLAVEVVAPDGAPAEGVELHLHRYPRGGTEHIDRRGRTDARGRCVFDGLPPGAYAALGGRHPVHGAIPWQTRIPFPAEGERLERIDMRPGRTLRGVVLDAVSGAPIAGARVAATWTLHDAVATDAEGRFELRGWGSNQEFQVTVAAEEFAVATRNVTVANDLEIRLEPGFAIAGRVVDAAGAPVAGARIGARGRVGAGLSLGEARADDAGRFEIAGLTRAADHALTVVAEGHGRTLMTVAPPPDGQDLVDVGPIRMPRARRVEGRVMRHDGTPAARIIVDIEGADAPRSATETRRTDDLGRFRFSDLSPGAYTVRAFPRTSPPVALDVELGPVTDLQDVELKLAGGRSFEVHVVDDVGQPVAWVHVMVGAEDGGGLQAETDVRGIARFEDARTFTRVLRVFDVASSRILPSQPRDVPTGVREVRVEVERVGRARGRVLGVDGAPIAQANFQVFRDGAPLDLTGPFHGNQAFSDAGGRFDVPVPRRGTVSLVLTGMVNPDWSPGKAYEPFRGRLDGVRAGDRGMVLQARPLVFDRELAVIVRAPDGEPVEGAQVYARVLGKLVEGANVLTDARGRGTLAGLPDTAIVVFARMVPPDPRARAWTDVSSVLTPAGQRVELTFRHARWIRGTVRLPDGEPAVHAYVQVLHAGTPLQYGPVDAEGRFEFKLPADHPRPLDLFANRAELQSRVDGIGDADEHTLRLTKGN